MSSEILEGRKKLEAARIYPISQAIDNRRQQTAKAIEVLRKPYIDEINAKIKLIDNNLKQKRQELHQYSPGTEKYNATMKEFQQLQQSRQMAEQSKQTAGIEDPKVQALEEDNAISRQAQLDIDRYTLPLLDGTLAQRSVEGTAALNALLDQRYRATFVAGGELFATGGIGAGEH